MINFGQWYFLNNSKYGGDARLEKIDVDGKTYANIIIDDGGTSTYAVQLEHLTSFAKGYLSKLVLMQRV